MAYTDINTPVVQKVTLPSGNEYYIADRQIRNVVEDLKEAIELLEKNGYRIENDL